MEIKNKREDLYASELPPKILSEDDVDDILDDGGYVTNTDYATSDTGGVIKYNNTIGTTVNSSGVLTGITRTEPQYISGGNGTFICKGTLENIIGGLVKRELIALLGGVDADVVGTTLTNWFATRTEDGWSIVAAKDTPTPP